MARLSGVLHNHCLKWPQIELPALLDAFTPATSFLEIGTYFGATSAGIELIKLRQPA
jgi:hypothetical protein